MGSIKYSAVRQYESINTYWTWLFLPHYNITFLECIRKPVKYHFYASFEPNLGLRISWIRSIGHEIWLCMCGEEIRWRSKRCVVLGCDDTNKCMFLCRQQTVRKRQHIATALHGFSNRRGNTKFWMSLLFFYYFLKFNKQVFRV